MAVKMTAIPAKGRGEWTLTLPPAKQHGDKEKNSHATYIEKNCVYMKPYTSPFLFGVSYYSVFIF